MPCGALVGPAWELSDDTIHPFGLGVLACLFDWLGRVNMAHGVFITRVGMWKEGGQIDNRMIYWSGLGLYPRINTGQVNGLRIGVGGFIGSCVG